MSLPPAALFPFTSTSFCEQLLTIDEDMLAFDGASTHIIPVPATSPMMLSRSSSYGYKGDISSYHVANTLDGYIYSHQLKQAPRTGTLSYAPMVTNEYAQLAELWSTTSSSSFNAPIQTSRASFDAVSDVSRTAESNNGLLDLFMQTYKPSAMTSVPDLIRSASAPVAGTFTCNLNSSGSKSTGKTKKCTYAARRREVSWLREESATLEVQLEKLRSALQRRHQTRESADHEKLLLTRANEENERLRAVTMAQEQQIRRTTDGLFNSSSLESGGSL